MGDTRKIEDNSVGKEVPRDGGQLAVELRKLLEQTAVQTGVANTSDKSLPKLTLEDTAVSPKPSSENRLQRTDTTSSDSQRASTNKNADRTAEHSTPKPVDRHVPNSEMLDIWGAGVKANGGKPLSVIKGYYEAGVRQVSSIEHPNGLIISSTESPIRLKQNIQVTYSTGLKESIKAGELLPNGVQISPGEMIIEGESRLIGSAKLIKTNPDGSVVAIGEIAGKFAVDRGQLARPGEYVVSRPSVDLETGKPRIDTYTNRDLSRWVPVEGKQGIYSPQLVNVKSTEVIMVPAGKQGTFDVSYGGTAPFRPGDLIVREDKADGTPAFRRISQADALETYRALDAKTATMLDMSALSLQREYGKVTIRRAAETAKEFHRDTRADNPAAPTEKSPTSSDNRMENRPETHRLVPNSTMLDLWGAGVKTNGGKPLAVIKG